MDNQNLMNQNLETPENMNQAPVEQSYVNPNPVEQPYVNQAPMEQPYMNQAPMEQPIMDDYTQDYAQAPYGQPMPQMPMNEQPMNGMPMAPNQMPMNGMPMNGQPMGYPNQMDVEQAYRVLAQHGVPVNLTPAKPPMTEEEKKQANLLCIISLSLYLLPIIIYLILVFISAGATASRIDDPYYVESQISNNSATLDAVFSIFSLLACGSFIAAIVLMIVARVKYPQSVFAKVLMWVYIVMFIIAVIGIAIVAISCAIACGNCLDDLRGCPGMISLLAGK